jgi:hypothetical protein
MKTLLFEMKFLVPNYSCLQNLWLGGFRPQIPILSVLDWICWTPPPEKNSWVRHWIRARWNNDSVLCVSPYNRPWKSRRGVNVQLYSFFNFSARWWVGAQLHAPSSVPLGRRPSTHCTEGWVGPIAGLDGCRKSRLHQDSITRLSSP